MAVGYQDGMVLAVRFADGKEVLLRRGGKGAITTMSWDGNGRRLAFGSESGEAGIIDIAAIDKRQARCKLTAGRYANVAARKGESWIR